ncbi:MAG: membrane protein insertion efficiency factor YidD [Candidatus Goldbacteria bacterium]|nr:membrane protein insertion efficiency factor YidD [Candidatus Goldiibacteriota bacterium]
MRRILFFFIRLYQKHAPKELRQSCRFEPTCSDYMMLAVEKYGLMKGVIKGVARIFRCHAPNGGIDYP